MNNITLTDKLIAIALGILVVCMMLFVVELGKIDAINNNYGVECGVDDEAVRRQIEDIDAIDEELMSSKYMEELK